MMPRNSPRAVASADPVGASGSEATRLRTDTERLLQLLHRGGNYAHLWTDAGNRSFWFPLTAESLKRTPLYHPKRNKQQLQQPPRYVPKQWLRHNVYFSVHPLSAIPPHNTTGVTDPRFISSQTPYICAINALFAEFDGKDFVYLRDYQSLLPPRLHEQSAVEQQQSVKTAQETIFYGTPAPFKARALRHIGALPHPPSIVIDSGGGYHCYWLLRQTVPLDESNRSDVQFVQHSWVQFVGGDRGAADLRRVLRLPGTYNHKAGFGAPQKVIFVRSDFGLLYDYRQLEEAVNDWCFEQERQRKRWRRRRGRRRQTVEVTAAQRAQLDAQSMLRQYFNEHHRIEDLLLSHGYRRCDNGRGPVRLARPGPHHHSSITIFAGGEEGRPERSIHFSTNDPLYSHEFADSDSGKIRRYLNDAFHIFVMLEHNGNWEAAYQAISDDIAEKASAIA